MDASAPSFSKQEYNSRSEKEVKSEFKLRLTFMTPDLVYKFEITCFRET